MKAKSKRLKFVSILMAFVIGATSITAFSAAEDANGITEITENTEIDTSETEEISKEAQEQTSNISEDDSKISDVQEDQDMPEELDVQKEQDALEEPGAQKDTTPDMAEESDSYSDRDVDADMSEGSDSQENSTQYTTEELDFAEIQKDWTMKATLLDSSVDGGNTELKSIDWDASDGGFLEGSGRNITLRISWQKFPGKENYERNSTGSIAGFTINATGMYAAQQFVKNQLPEHIQFLSSMLMPGYDRCKLTDGQVRLVTELLG